MVLLPPPPMGITQNHNAGCHSYEFRLICIIFLIIFVTLSYHDDWWCWMILCAFFAFKTTKMIEIGTMIYVMLRIRAILTKTRFSPSLVTFFCKYHHFITQQSLNNLLRKKTHHSLYTVNFILYGNLVVFFLLWLYENPEFFAQKLARNP